MLGMSHHCCHLIFLLKFCSDSRRHFHARFIGDDFDHFKVHFQSRQSFCRKRFSCSSKGIAPSFSREMPTTIIPLCRMRAVDPCRSFGKSAQPQIRTDNEKTDKIVLSIKIFISRVNKFTSLRYYCWKALTLPQILVSELHSFTPFLADAPPKPNTDRASCRRRPRDK